MKFLCRLDDTPYEVFKPVGVQVKAKLMARAPAMKCKIKFKSENHLTKKQKRKRLGSRFIKNILILIQKWCYTGKG